jgi:hypothetical protein
VSRPVTWQPRRGIVTGYAVGNVASVPARLADGTTRPVLRLDGRFLYGWTKASARPVAIVGEDAAGHVVGVLRVP